MHQAEGIVTQLMLWGHGRLCYGEGESPISAITQYIQIPNLRRYRYFLLLTGGVEHDEYRGVISDKLLECFSCELIYILHPWHSRPHVFRWRCFLLNRILHEVQERIFSSLIKIKCIFSISTRDRESFNWRLTFLRAKDIILRTIWKGISIIQRFSCQGTDYLCVWDKRLDHMQIILPITALFCWQPTVFKSSHNLTYLKYLRVGNPLTPYLELTADSRVESTAARTPSICE